MGWMGWTQSSGPECEMSKGKGEGGMRACMYSMYLEFRYGTVQYKALTLTVLP